MSIEELQNIIDQFDNNALEPNAKFGISQYGGGSDESYIRANREGLLLYALELLKAAKNIEPDLTDNQDNTISLPTEGWVDDTSDTLLHYVELVGIDQKAIANQEKMSIAKRLLPYGCGLALAFMVACAVIGFIKIMRWFF